MFEQVRHYSRLHIFSFEKIILLKSFLKILRGNAKTIKIQLSFGAGGRGLCVGEAKNRAGKEAMSRPKEAGQNAKRSEVFGRLIEGEAKPLRVERGRRQQVARNVAIAK